MKNIFLCIALCSACVTYAQQKTLLVIADPHLQLSSTPMPLNPSAEHRGHDLDVITFQKLIQRLQHQMPKPDYVILLGDLNAHHAFHTKQLYPEQAMVFQTLHQAYPHRPLFYVFGNNDSPVRNYGPFQTHTAEGHIESPYHLAITAAGWRDGFLSSGYVCTQHKAPCLLNENTEHGYYAAQLAPGLRLMALNSVLFSTSRHMHNPDAARQQLTWLHTQLQLAQQDNAQVLLAMHISPGTNLYDGSTFWFPQETAVFLNLIQKYHHHILGLLTAHTHHDEIKIIQNASKQPLIGIYNTPALSTAHGNAPAFKIFDLAQKHKTWQLKNATTFFFSGTREHLTLQKLYDYQNTYCPHPNTATLTLTQCLRYVTAEKIKKYYMAGNTQTKVRMRAPNALYLYP